MTDREASRTRRAPRRVSVRAHCGTKRSPRECHRLDRRQTQIEEVPLLPSSPYLRARFLLPIIYLKALIKYGPFLKRR